MIKNLNYFAQKWSIWWGKTKIWVKNILRVLHHKEYHPPEDCWEMSNTRGHENKDRISGLSKTLAYPEITGNRNCELEIFAQWAYLE